MKATAIVVAYDGGDLLAACVAALQAYSPAVLRVVVLDNASRDGSVERLMRMQSRVEVFRAPTNLGFAGGVNAAIAGARVLDTAGDDDVVVLVNQDCRVTAGWLEPLCAALAEPGVAVAGACILDADGATLQHAGGIVEANGLTRHLGRGQRVARSCAVARDVDYVTGALFACSVGTWRRFGPFDEGYHPVYFEEVDFCMRVRAAGLRVRYVAGSRALHCEGASSGGVGSRLFLDRYHRSRMRFAARHLLVRGHAHAWLRAELAWLCSLRDRHQLGAVLRAYRRLPGQWLQARRIGTEAGR